MSAYSFSEFESDVEGPLELPSITNFANSELKAHEKNSWSIVHHKLEEAREVFFHRPPR